MILCEDSVQRQNLLAARNLFLHAYQKETRHGKDNNSRR